MASCIRRPGIATKIKLLHPRVARIKGNVDRLTSTGVVMAAENAFKPLVIMPGMKPHFRRHADGVAETVHSYLLPCYLFHRRLADGYRRRVQPTILMLFKELGAIGLAPLSRMSNVLQPC